MTVAVDPREASKAASNIPAQPDALRLSPSVRAAARRFDAAERTTAIRLASAIWALHTEYAGGRVASLRLDEAESAERCSTDTWLAEVRTLFDPDLVPELHGRQTILGLSLLDRGLRDQLKASGVFAALVAELREPFDDTLTRRGRELYDPPDSVPNQPDNPLRDSDEDRLGRDAFAKYLARRISLISQHEEGAYAIHLYGPWGSGKTTLLNFLGDELRRDDWLVVEFNAWQSQQIRPPWWALYERVFQTSRPALSWPQLVRTCWWRLTAGRIQHLVGFTAVAWLIVVAMALMPADQVAEQGVLPALAGFADKMGSILALLLTVWTIVQATNRSLLFGSAEAARSYTERTSEPMHEICKHFTALVRRVRENRRRIVIFIDDLDRCQSAYVVELLEGVQTVFRRAPVIFVVAADRRWLNACFEEVYDKLRPSVHEPGKPLGTLFLEKTFQMSVSVPGISAQLKDAFWRHLIKVEARRSGEADVERMQELVNSAPSERALIRMVEESRDRPYEEQRTMRKLAVERLADPGLIERTEHALRPLAPLLEPNPRSMKRLVNAYSAYRALALLSEVDIRQGPLARWTILSLRWPSLADYLEEHPEQVEQIGAQPPQGVPRQLQALFADPEVRQVALGDEHTRIDRGIVEQCALLRG